MDLFIIALLIIIFYTVYLYNKKSQNYFEEYNVPYSPGKPFLGNMSIPFFDKVHVNEPMLKLYNENPEAKYFGFFEFTKPGIVIRDLELLKNVFIKNFDSFPNHRTFVDANIDPLMAGNLFGMKDEMWREARTLLSPAFTTSKMKSMHELIFVCAQNLVDYLGELSEKDRNMVDTKDILGRYTTDVIATCGFGLRVDSLRNPNNDFFIMGKEAAEVDAIRLLKIFIGMTLPSLSKIIDIKFFNKRVANFFTNVVKNIVDTRDQEGITRPDMIQLMMDARGKENSNLKLNYETMTAQVLVFFFGGSESTSTTMSAMAHELTINPDVQKRLQDEIDNIMLKTHGKPTYEDIQRMLYLDAVFNETMRLHPPNGIMDRVCKKSFELPPALPGGKPFIVQPGMVIFNPIAAIHRDSKYFKDPNLFNPDRYYTKEIKINDATSLGFGIGPRSCIGNRMAILEIKILFILLLHKFNLIPNEKTCRPFIYDPSTFTVRPKGGFWLAIDPRNDKVDSLYSSDYQQLYQLSQHFN